MPIKAEKRTTSKKVKKLEIKIEISKLDEILRNTPKITPKIDISPFPTDKVMEIEKTTPISEKPQEVKDPVSQKKQ